MKIYSLTIAFVILVSCSSNAIDEIPQEDTLVKTDYTHYRAMNQDNSRYYELTVVTEFTNVTNDTCICNDVLLITPIQLMVSKL